MIKKFFAEHYIFVLVLCSFVILLIAGENLGDATMSLRKQDTPQQEVKPSESGKPIIIVPDRPTFLYYLSTWTPEKRFPIFVGADKYVEKFARVYNDGDNHYVYADKEKLPAIDQSLVYRALLASFAEGDLDSIKEDASSDDLREYFISHSIEPKGVVVTSLSSSELLGGLALASHHRQVLDFYDPPAAPLFGTYPTEVKEQIRKAIIEHLDSWEFEYRGLGRGIDTLTLALDMPIKYNHGFSLDDAINRETPDAIRPYAYTGRLMDLGKGLAVYQAMCSLFLDTTDALFFDRWPEKWGRSLKLGCYAMRKKIPSVWFHDFKDWRSVTNPINTYDFIFVNAAGYPSEWSGGTMDDIPDTLPVAINFSHSSSANDPTNPDTIAGRWLINGAFAYYGSISEPYADSFNVSYDIVTRIIDGIPFARATAEKSTLPSNRVKPWKLIFIGDPLFCPSFRVKSEENEFFDVMRRVIEELELLNFGSAQNMLEKYLNINELKVENTIPYNQAKEYLERLYQLMICEQIFGISLQKRYSKKFILSWMSDYPSILALRREMFKYEEKLVDLYQAQYDALKSQIVKGSFWGKLWQDILRAVRKRLDYIPEWQVIQEIPDMYFEDKTLVESILQSELKSSLAIGGQLYHWRTYRKNPFTNKLEAVARNEKTDQVWIAQTTFTATKGCEPFFRLLTLCATDFYLDGKKIISYSGEEKYGFICEQVSLSEGDHRLVLLFKPSKKQPCEIAITVTDSNYASVEEIEFHKTGGN